MSWDDLGVGAARSPRRCTPTAGSPTSSSGSRAAGCSSPARSPTRSGSRTRPRSASSSTPASTSGSSCRCCCRPCPTSSTSASARVLIADDVADTGATLELVRDFCAGRVGRGAGRRPLREVALDGRERLRLAPHRQLDHVPLERAAAGHRRRRRVAPLLSAAAAAAPGRSRARSGASRCIVPSARIRRERAADLRDGDRAATRDRDDVAATELDPRRDRPEQRAAAGDEPTDLVCGDERRVADSASGRAGAGARSTVRASVAVGATRGRERPRAVAPAHRARDRARAGRASARSRGRPRRSTTAWSVPR